MTFDDLEVGKEYVAGGGSAVTRRRIVAKASKEVVTEMLAGALAEQGEPFLTYQSRYNFSDWRLYAPPPAPVVRYAFAAVCSWDDKPVGDICSLETGANNDSRRVGPVIKIELPVDPDMLARVKGGAS